MKRLSIFFAALLVSVGSIFAQEEVYKTISFAADNATRGNKVGSYSTTWESATNGFAVSIANFNNNNWGWTNIRCGSKNNASVATITTKAAIDKAITKVVVTIDAATAKDVNSTTLTIASDATFTSDVQTVTVAIATGALSYVVENPAKDMFYKLTYDCKKSSANKNGFVSVSKIEYYASSAEVPATAIALDKETITLDKGATEQLTATLTPADATTAVVWTTENAEIATVDKGLVTAVGVGTTNITATVTPAEGTTYTATCAVTVVAAPDAPVFTVTEPVFEGTMNVAITAAEGMAIYYTTDGAEPTIESTKYEAPFAITATTTVKAIAYDATISKASVAAEMTYTKAMTCAEANAAAKNDVINLNTVTVVYVNGANIYVADATGTTLVFAYDFGLKAGQVVKGLAGTMDIYNGLPEVKPSVALKDLTITEGGTIPAPEVITTAPTMADINKYIKMEGVAMNEASFTSAGKQSVKGTFAEAELTFYNTFKIDQEFEARKYNVIGFVSAFKTMQIAVVSAEALYNITATANDETMGTVTGAGEYAAGTEVTLKATPAKGYQFVKWSNDETANPYTFTASDDVTLTAEFSVVPKHIYAYNLNSKLENGSYTFTFDANEDATAASLIFYDATTGELAGEVELANVVKGANTHVIAADALPGTKGQTMVWAVELEANPVNVLTKIYADEAPAYRRGYANVDANPESDFFGQMYVADRVKTKANSRLYVYDQNYVTKDANGYQLGESVWDFGRFGIAQDGTLYLSDYGDAHSGIYVVNPADLTKASQFFVGTRTSTGLIKNGDVETGSSIAACSFVGTGANAKLVAVAEDYTGKSFPVAIFNVGQEDGTIAATWDAAPSKMFDTKGNLSQNFDIQGCEKGVWVAQSRSDGQNNSSATSLRFYDWDGNCTWSSADHTDVINGSLGGGVALTANENQVIVKAEGTSVKVFDVTWAESTPTLTLAATYDCGYTAVSTISLDYAGNMIVVGGTAFGSTDTKRMSAAVFSVPTSNNISVVPAKKAMTVTKTAIATNLEDINVNGIEVKKIVRDGQVYIIRDGKTYNMMGQVVE